jgi:hypothetical protein
VRKEVAGVLPSPKRCGHSLVPTIDGRTLSKPGAVWKNRETARFNRVSIDGLSERQR